MQNVSQTVAAAIEGRNEGVEWKASSLSQMENLHDCSRVKLSYARTALHASFHSQYAILETILLMRWQNRSPGTCQILSSERAFIICSQQTVSCCLTEPPTTAVSSEAWAKLHEWAILAGKGRLLLSGSRCTEIGKRRGCFFKLQPGRARKRSNPT